MDNTECIISLMHDKSNYLFHQYKTETDTDLLDNLHIMYLTEGDMFEDNVEDYVLTTIKTKTNLWEQVYEKLDNYKDIINNVIDVLNESTLTLGELLFASKVFLHNKRTIDIIHTTNFIIHENVKDNITTIHKHCLFSKLINFISNDNIVFHTLNIFLTNDLFKEKYVSYIVDILNNNKLNVSVTLQNEKYLSNSNFLFSLHSLISKHYNEDLIDGVDMSYFTNKSCHIRLFEQTDDIKEYDFNTKMFCIYIYSLHISYISLICKYKNWKYMLKEVDKNIRDISQSSIPDNLLTQMLTTQYKLRAKLNNTIKELHIIYSNIYVFSSTAEFFNNFAKLIMNTEVSIRLDDILNDMLYFLNDMKARKIDILEKNTIKLINRIIGTKKYTSNPHIRISFLRSILSSKLDEEEYNNNISESIINLYNEISLTKDEGLELEKISSISLICKYILDNNEKVSNDVKHIYESDSYKIKTFVNFVISNISDICPILESNLDKYLTIESDLELQTHTRILNSILDYMISLLDTFILLRSNLKPVFMLPEINISVKISLLSIIRHLCKYSDNQEIIDKLKKIYDYTLTTVGVKRIINKLVEFLVIHITNSEIAKNIFEDNDIDLDRLYAITNNEKLLEVKKLKSEIEETKEDELEYPEEFLDSLLYTPLTDPVLIPNTNVFVNKATIEQHIMTNGFNPYTKEKLTSLDLKKFNDLDDNKEKINSIIDKMRIWKNKQSNK